MTEALRVLFLEDEPRDAEQVEKALDRAGIPTVIRVVTSADAFTRALPEFAPDLVLSDHAGARFNAVHAIATLRATKPTTPLFVVTGAFNEKVLVESIKAGAEDCIFKDRLERLAPAIRAALTAREPLRRLTARQLQVLQLLVEGRSTREAAQRLHLSVKTVESHRAAVMQRLDIHDLPALVRYAMRVGLLAPEP